jgi:purine-binding chemotaxis protein CheW
VNQTDATASVPSTLELVTMTLAGHAFGVEVRHVHDVLGPQTITWVPLACDAIAGSINLRGRIVTVLDLGVVLQLGRSATRDRAMNVVVADDNDLYALLVDQVGDVLTVPGRTLEPLPPTLPFLWKEISDGIVRLPDQLLLTLAPERILADIKRQTGTMT